MIVSFYINKSDNNVVDKDITNEISYDCVMKHECDVYRPIVRITLTPEQQSSVVMGLYNYCYIERYKRYYYITSMTTFPNGVYEITLRCDVLMTYKADFRNCEAVIKRNANNYNLYMSDGDLYLRSGRNRKIINFENKFNVNNGYYVLQTI